MPVRGLPPEGVLPPAAVGEVVGKVESLLQAPGPAHHYIDLTAPVSTLLLSIEEYGPPSPGRPQSNEVLKVRH